jgi:NADPH-dependent 2,4-dienoyl-CoA reductase/sulfur reductase-like enzyme
MDPPYTRPWLTKDLWRDKPIEKVFKKTAPKEAEVITGRTITSLDARERTAIDDSGETYSARRILIATGATPKPFPFGGELVINFRQLQDYRRLRELTDTGKRFAVIGGGFIGSELAASLRSIGKDVDWFLTSASMGKSIFPAGLADSLTVYFLEKGVDVHNETKVTDITKSGSAITVAYELADGSSNSVEVDGVVAGIGVTPNVELAQAAGIKVEDGILVDHYLQTNIPDIYAAGDVASYFQDSLGTRRRVEHEDNANVMGRHAGHMMAGRIDPWNYLPMFYSDLFDIGYEAVGELDESFDIVEDWSEEYRTGVVYYLQHDHIRGALMVNVFGQVDKARELIQARTRFAGLSDADRIPNSNPAES